MANPAVMTIGFPCNVSRPEQFLGVVNFREYEFIAADMSVLFLEIIDYCTKTGDLSRPNYRFQQLGEWVAAGHTLIAIVTFVPDLSPWPSQVKVNLLANITYSTVAGQRIEYCGPASGNELLTNWTERLNYTLLIASPDLQPLFRVRHTRPSGPAELVGAIRKWGDGHVLLVPPLDGRDPVRSNQEYLDRLMAFAYTLKTQRTLLPEWTTTLWTEDEAAARRNITELEANIARLTSQIEAEGQAIAAATELKQLIAGTGDQFKDTVAAALRELGLEVVEGPNSPALHTQCRTRP
jgi:hypothetical protein